jgi:hypothetical protein
MEARDAPHGAIQSSCHPGGNRVIGLGFLLPASHVGVLLSTEWHGRVEPLDWSTCSSSVAHNSPVVDWSRARGVGGSSPGFREGG